MEYNKLLEDLEAQHPDFLRQYETLAQQYYAHMSYHDTFAIPKSHMIALLTLLNESGYKINKVVTAREDNIVYLNNNVLNFKKGVV